MRWENWSRGGLLVVLLVCFSSQPLVAIDNWDSVSPDDDAAADTLNILIPGEPPQRHDAEAISTVPDEDWYRIPVVQNHSYEVRVGSRQDSCFDFVADNFQVLQSDGTTQITTGVDFPGIGTFPATYRAVFVAPNNNHVFVRLVGDTDIPTDGTSSCTSTSEYTIQVFETTLLNPRWSTFGGFTTQWGFHNVTNATITGRLRIFRTDGTSVADVTFGVQPGRVVFQVSSTLGIAANQAGNAVFTHNGSMGDIQADAFLVSSDVTSVIPAKFEPRSTLP